MAFQPYETGRLQLHSVYQACGCIYVRTATYESEGLAQSSALDAKTFERSVGNIINFLEVVVKRSSMLLIKNERMIINTGMRNSLLWRVC